MEEPSNTRKPFQMSAGHTLSCKYWNATKNEPAALVFIAHGYGEHCCWYDKLAQQLIDRECYVFAHDHIGHGESEGNRATIGHFPQYVADLFEHTDAIKARFPADTKFFIIGHSMGGLIAVQAAIDRPHYFSGVILISPFLELPKTLNLLESTALRLLAPVLPNMQLVKIDPKVISRDEEKVRAYSEDPLIWHGGVKAQWLRVMQQTMDDLRPCLTTVETPFLAMHGTEDKLAAIHGSRNLYEKAASEDKTLKIYEGYYHQLHSEPDPDGAAVLQEICDWITARLG